MRRTLSLAVTTALLVAGAWAGTSTLDLHEAAADSGSELPFPVPACSDSSLDAGVSSFGVAYHLPVYPCMFQNSVVDGAWQRLMSATGPSEVEVDEEGKAQITLSASGTFTRTYNNFSFFYPNGDYSIGPTWDIFNAALQYADDNGKFHVSWGGYSPWTIEKVGGPDACEIPSAGTPGPASAPGSCTYEVDTSSFPLGDRTALLAIGIRYGVGVRYVPFGSEPSLAGPLLFCDGGGPYSCVGGDGSNPSHAAPVGFAWVAVKLVGPGANHPPTAAFDATRTAPGQYQFVSSSTDPDVGDALDQVWDFGDGSPPAIGPAVTHTYTKPGTYTATLTVTDTHGATQSTSREVVVDAPALGVSISFLEHETDRFTPDEWVAARVRVEATADGIGSISDVRFDPAVLTASGSVALRFHDAVPPGFSLAPGEARTFDALLQPVALGDFELASTVTGTDASGRAVVPSAATKHGNVSALRVTLDAGGVTDDAFDVTMTVQNLGDAPVTGITYPGGGVADRSALVPEPLRGAVGLASGPTPALPDMLGPGQQATATFHYVADEIGTVVLVGEARSEADGVRVSGSDDVQVEIGRAPLLPASLRDAMGLLAQADYQHLSDLMFRMRRAANERVIAYLQAAEGTGGSTLRPASSPDELVPIDNAQLLLAALEGTGIGVTTSAQKLWEFGVENPLAYYSGMWNGGKGAAWTDFVDAWQGTVDEAAFGGWSATFEAYDIATSELNDGKAYTDLTEAMIEDNKQRELLAAEVQPKVDAFSAAVDGFLVSNRDRASTDPEGFARDLMAFTSEGISDTVMGEALTIGGIKLIEKGAEAYEYSRFGTKGAALRRLSTGETLESLGAGAVSAANVERLGGITTSDQAKIQKVVKELNEEFDVDLEIQARPSNVYSVELLNHPEGALPKPEVFKAKNLSDLDVALGADPAARGQLGVYKPELPSEARLKSMDPGLAQELRDRFVTQQKIWKEWNDPSSKFAKAYKQASQEGGHTFQFATPAEAGAVPGSRSYHIEVGSTNMSGTTVTITEKSGRPIVSDIDFHAYIKTNGKHIDASKRARIELELQRRWKAEGIAYGDHGATLNGYDWPGLTATEGKIARERFLLEFSSKEEALRRAEELSALTGVPVSEIMKGFQPGKFVIKFQADSTYVGHGAL